MKPCRLFLALTILLVGLQCSLGLIRTKNNKVVACYVASWANYRQNDGRFQMNDLRAEHCTHVIYAFAGLNNTSWTIRSLDPDIEINNGNYRKMTDLRHKYPNIRFSLAIGGWNEGSKNYSELASSPTNRKTFISSVLQFLRDFGFDGFDWDWEFPGSRGGAPYDKGNFVALVKEMKEAFESSKYLLTAAISANQGIIDQAYDIPELSKYLDFIYVMAYDYHGTWDPTLLPNSPLKSTDGHNIEATVSYLLSKGTPANKLVLGLPMYGRTYILATKPSNPNESPIGQKHLGKGFKGPFTGEEGFMGYNEICQDLVKHPEEWSTGWDRESSTPYAINGDRVVVYDDHRSMKAKIEYILKMDLAGVMVWSIDTDDFRGRCATLHDFMNPSTGFDFPLMKSINMALMNKESPPLKPKKSSAMRLQYNFFLILSVLLLSYF